MSNWNGVRVLVTGHTGFKGSWLCSRLLAAGARVTGFALPPSTDPSLFDLLGLARDVDSIVGDVRDAAAVAAAVRRADPQVVFHLAAQAIVLTSIDDPVTTFGTNVMGTVHVLDALRHAPSLEAVVVVTSDKCYANDDPERACAEDDALGGKEPYSASKACSELVTASYRHSFFAPRGTPVASARAGNVIGGGDWSRGRIVPDIARAVADGREPVLRYPGAIRPWQHVLDAISGYVVLAEFMRAGADVSRAWNFGPDETSIRTAAEVATRFLTLWGKAPDFRIDTSGSEHEALSLRLDSARSKRALGWVPTLPFDDAVDWTAAWYRAWHDGDDLRAMTAQQLERHATLMLSETR